jgi:glutamine synthetase
MLTFEELVARVRAGDIDTVITAATDLQGRLIGKRVHAPFFIEHAADHGTHVCTYLLATDMEMNTPDGFADQTWSSGYGDYLLRPDWNTLRRIPWLPGTALVLCDIVDEASGLDIEVAPRSVLKRQIARAAAAGFTIKMATELEFYLFRDSYETAHQKSYENLERYGIHNEDYQLLQGTRAEPFYRRLRTELSAAGVPIEFTKGEAAIAQHEINIHYADALESADRAVLLKHGTKEIALLEGISATFMAKPSHDWTGSSGHIHLSLWNEAGNAFPAETESGMSEVMRWFLGGMMANARDFSILIASNVNSYKRFASASWAPVYLVWGRDNRTCAFRVVGQGSGLRIENRLPGSDSNPYLAFASVIAAGLDGIARQVDPPEIFRGNAYDAQKFPRIPRTLYEAIDCWDTSESARSAFGSTVHAHYLNMARIEQESFDSTVTNWERTRYFERG